MKLFNLKHLFPPSISAPYSIQASGGFSNGDWRQT